MNIVFLSPHFPPSVAMFCIRLREAGATVLGLADAPYESLRPELRAALSEYYRVDDMHDRDALIRALGYFTHRYGKIDRIDLEVEPLPPVVDYDTAIENPELVHGAFRDSNLAGEFLVPPDDELRAIFESEAHVVTETFVQNRYLPVPMEARGIVVRAASMSGVAEEAGFAYKDLSAVVEVLARADISRPVVSLTPIGNIKG